MSHLTDMMERVKKLKNGVGVQSLLDSAYEILGNPIAMFNTEYNLLAHTEVITDDPLWNELVTYGTFSTKTQKLFDNEGFIEALANAPRIAFMISDKLKYDRICGKLFNKNNSYVSNLVIVACNKPFDEESDPIVFKNICNLISKEISSNEFYQEYEQTHQEAIINNLIDGNYDVKLDVGQVEIIYDSLESNLYILVADTSQCDKEHSPAYFRDLFKQADHACKYAIHDDYIVIIISTNNDHLKMCKELSALIKVFEQNNIYAGISSRFENLFELQKYYKQALEMMRYALEVKSDQRIFPCSLDSIDKMEQIKSLENGLGIQYFLNLGHQIFGNPLLFHDMELNLLAYTENVEIIDPIWEELITYGTSSSETIDLFRTEGFIDIMDNTKGGAFLISKKIKYDRISWRIYNNDNIRIGCTSIVNTMNPFSEDELVLFGVFSRKFSKEVGKIDFYNNYGQVYSDTIINRLISGKIDDYTFYTEDIGNLYDHLMHNIYLIVIDVTRCSSEYAHLNHLRDLFNHSDTVNRYAIYSNHIIIIISTDNASLYENNGFDEISEVFRQNNIYAGISNRFENIYELQKHYNEAVNALNVGIKQKNPSGMQRIFRCGTENDS